MAQHFLNIIRIRAIHANFPCHHPMKKYGFLLLLLTGLLACDTYPNDPDKTLTQVQTGTLRVGYSENPPWVVKTAQEPRGIEPTLIKAFAKTQDIRIEWVNDSEQDLMLQLEKRELHLVVSGLLHNSPWSQQVSFTRPYLRQDKKKRVMAVLKGENAFILELEKYLFRQEEKLKASLQP
jgi:polar amino acid transport system substrate-binding protein